MKKRGWLRALVIILPFIVVTGFFQLLGAWLTGLPLLAYAEQSAFQSMVLNGLTCLGTFLLVWLFTKLFDQQSVWSLGFNRRFSRADFGYSTLAVVFSFSLGFVILLALGQLQFQSIQFEPLSLLMSFVLFAAVAVNEELFVRGYILKNLAQSTNETLALVLSSLLFGLLHFLNPNISWVAVVNLFLAGILLGLAYLCKRNLWLPISIHFFWNFTQTHLGYEVSGQKAYSLIQISEPSSTVWNGGEFGFEGSLIAVAFQLIAIAWLWRLYRRQKATTGKLEVETM